MANHWLAFDIGTTGAKAALVDSMGHVLRSVVREYPTHTATGGVMEQGQMLAQQCLFDTAIKTIGYALESPFILP